MNYDVCFIIIMENGGLLPTLWERKGCIRNTKFGVITIEILVLWAHCRLICYFSNDFALKTILKIKHTY